MKEEAEKIKHLIKTKFIPKYKDKNIKYKCYASKTESLYLEVSTMVNGEKHAVNQRYSNHRSKHFKKEYTRAYYKKNQLLNIEKQLEKMTKKIINIRIRKIAETLNNERKKNDG